MVIGLKIFQEHFASFHNSYVLIGGSACDVNLRAIDAPFRVTKDIDIVLLVEALTPDFISHFWKFVKNGGYKLCQTSTGKKKFYRFQKPAEEGYPLMLELFSRHPDFDLVGDNVQLTPIPSEDECSSLSAILLDDEYYRFIHANIVIVDGLPIASPLSLVILKAKAWMDLSLRKKNGESVDSADIRKHKNDIARLASMLEGVSVELPTKIKDDMKLFLVNFQNEKIDTKALGLALNEGEIKNLLRSMIGESIL